MQIEKESIDSVLQGKFNSKFFDELFANSIHFPLAVVIFELLNTDVFKYLGSFDPYCLIFSALMQTFLILKFTKTYPKIRFVFNLTAPLLYTILETSIDGLKFFNAPQHIAFWVYAILITYSQYFYDYKILFVRYFFVLQENIIRSLIPIMIYFLFEVKSQNIIAYFPVFF